MDEVDLEMRKREVVNNYFSVVRNSECYNFVNSMYSESKERLCTTFGIAYDNEMTSYETIIEQAGISKEQFDMLTESGLKSMMVTRVKKYHTSFFGGEEFEAYSVGLASDLKLGLLDYATALQYLCNVFINTGVKPIIFDYVRLKGNMNLIISSLGLDDEVRKNAISFLERNEAGQFLNLLLTVNKLWDFFNQLFRTWFISLSHALSLLVEDNDKVGREYTVRNVKIDGKEYWLYPFF